MRKTALIYIIILIFFSCGKSFHGDLTEYELALKEIRVNKTFLDSLFSRPDAVMLPETIELNDFTTLPQLKRNLPACYKLLGENKAERIEFKSDNCIFIFLKYQDGWFSDTIEWLKIGSDMDCKTEPGEDIKKDKLIKPGWRYQVVSRYTLD